MWESIVLFAFKLTSVFSSLARKKTGILSLAVS